MVNYTQLKEIERTRIYSHLKQGYSQGKIAEVIGRSKSTISREIARNSDRIGYLYPRDAQKKTEGRKAKHGSKIDRNPAMKKYVLKGIRAGESPNVIAACWSSKHPSKRIAAETIYQYVYREENMHLALWKLLPKAKSKRGMQRKQRSTGDIAQRTSIHERPAEVETRETFGHYEADLVFNSGSQSANILTIVERKSRVVKLVKHKSKHSQPIIDSLAETLGSDAKSCTFDNGKEFALHYKLGIPTYFCDPGSPWQKGSIENMNGLLRRYVPFDLGAKDITQEYLDQVADIMNNRPRKILGFLTPNQVFNQNRESRLKPASPAEEVFFYQNRASVALHA